MVKALGWLAAVLTALATLTAAYSKFAKPETVGLPAGTTNHFYGSVANLQQGNNNLLMDNRLNTQSSPPIQKEVEGFSTWNGKAECLVQGSANKPTGIADSSGWDNWKYGNGAAYNNAFANPSTGYVDTVPRTACADMLSNTTVAPLTDKEKAARSSSKQKERGGVSTWDGKAEYIFTNDASFNNLTNPSTGYVETTSNTSSASQTDKEKAARSPILVVK